LHTLRHSNLPRVTDYFVILGQGQYLVMDYVEGEDLQEKLNHSIHPLSESDVIFWMIQICGALAFLHNQNPPIIHRDIKPANIRITPEGNAMLVDLGIAKTYDPGKRTTTGARAVSHGYSPMEQYGSGGRTDQRSDIYSLGATIYSLLTGQVPIEAPERNLGVELPPPKQINPSISGKLEKTILHALETMPEKRFQRISDLKTELEKLYEVPKTTLISSVASQPTIKAKMRIPIYWIG
jgi:eukaryotic-like serine/threonine-protein kinase